MGRERDTMPKESVAPYNFVSLYENVFERYKSLNELPSHGVYEKNCLSGYINYTIKAKSPIFISEGAEYGENGSNKIYEFFKNQHGKYAIPGSTVRGLIRSNVQILGLSSPEGDIQDTLFLFRALADKNKKLRDEYIKMIDIKPQEKTPGKVRAGYIYKEDKDKYVIIPAKHKDGRTFYSVRETALRKADKKNIGISYMYTEKITNFSFNLRANKNQELKRWYNKLNDNTLRGFRPYMMKISFDAKFLDNGGINLIEVDNNDRTLKNKGYLLCSGFMKKKISHYLINEMDPDGKKIELDKEDVRAYNEDLIRKKCKNEYYYLPDKIGIEYAKPVFYVDGEKRRYFGFTPYLRIFYNNSVKNGISENLKRNVLDYAKAMFGFAEKENSYKSRLSFEDAEIVNIPNVLNETQLILGEPKPTCYPDYIEQSGTSDNSRKTYNDKGFKIRGIKQYWLKDSIANCNIGNNTNVAVKIKPLDAGAIFKGKIYFNNLHSDELGLLLWALKLEEGCMQNIGLAKPYGYGKIQIMDLELKVEDYNKKYNAFTFDFHKPENIEKYIKEYKEYIKKNFNGLDVDNDVISIKEFLIIKSQELSREESRYMKIKNSENKNEFAERNALPTIFEKGKEKNNKFAINESVV